ncbi:MAG TPA: zinc ribbon domain-containing protein [Solirubrobacteraceae bacterium]|nr:zinc ribbon domain-containing protein [Solirubrobacteraceae bacterium]
MDQTSGTTPAGAEPEAPDSGQPGGPEATGTPAGTPGFGARGRMRRRARFLRKARELAYRDLGGLVFNLHRFGQRNDALVLGKLNTLGHIDAELRALEGALHERETVTVLREAGITACPRCAAIHSGDDRFCPNCGLSMSRHVDLPIAGPATGAPTTAPPSPPPTATAPPAAPPRGAATADSNPAAGAPAAPGGAPDGPSGARVEQVTASWPAPPPADDGAAPGSSWGPAPSTGPTPAAARAGRSPTPPPRSSSPQPGAEEKAAEEERTEILHPVEPEQ